VVVENPAVIGRPVQEIRALDQLSCQVTRRLRDGRMEPLGHDEPLEAGDELLLVVDAQEAELAVALFGARSGHRAVLDTDRERAQVVITNPELFGRTLRDLDLPSRYGVTLSRLTRYELEMVPTGDLRLRPGDQVSLVGTPEAIARFMKLAGHRTRALHETDLVSLSAALVVGLVLGVTPVILPGGEEFRLGLAGGPLFVGLLLGHFGQVGPLSGDVPRAARLLLSELGLALFLANAGVVAGRDLVATVEARGLVLALAGMGITLAALLGGWLVARRGMKLDLAAALGGLCGGMTSTPGIGALTAKGDAERAVASYAAAYPVALILMGLAAQLLVSLIA
jgi:putative transport protein